jgi:hypothetical protein
LDSSPWVEGLGISSVGGGVVGGVGVGIVTFGVAIVSPLGSLLKLNNHYRSAVTLTLVDIQFHRLELYTNKQKNKKIVD